LAAGGVLQMAHVPGKCARVKETIGPHGTGGMPAALA
jgi:hypothetical protein